jgi:hypothetical protein
VLESSTGNVYSAFRKLARPRKAPILTSFSFGFQSPEDLKLFVGFFSVFYGLQLKLSSKHPSWNFPHKTLYRIYVIKLDSGQNIVKL